jgi:hypothetical protein
MVQPDPQTGQCSWCGGVAEPFGALRQWFARDTGELLCLACAERDLPDVVRIAREAEKHELARGGSPTE